MSFGCGALWTEEVLADLSGILEEWRKGCKNLYLARFMRLDCLSASMKKRPEHLQALARQLSREAWDYADRFCARLPEVLMALREAERLSMYELQLRTQVQRETTSKVESRAQLPGLHALARIAYVLAGTVEGLVRQVEVACRRAKA